MAWLGISRDADAKTIKNAYYQGNSSLLSCPLITAPNHSDTSPIYLFIIIAAKKCHPDLNPNDAAAKARFQRLAAAYEVLSDPTRRKIYDSTGQTSTQQQGYQQQSRPGAGAGTGAGRQYQYVYEEDPSKHAEQVFRGVFEVGIPPLVCVMMFY